MRAVFFCCTIFLFISCKKGDCIKNTGNQTLERRILPYFNELYVYDDVEVILKEDTGYAVVVEGGENLLNKISTKVAGDHLSIKNNNTCNWVRSYANELKVYVTCPGLPVLHQYGSGKISSEGAIQIQDFSIYQYGTGDIDLNLIADKIGVDLNGVGNVKLSGQSKLMTAHLYNLGNIRFGVLNSQALTCKELQLKSDTQANAFVRADSLLSVMLSDIGNVFYTGNPKTEYTKTGKGALIHQ